MKTGSLKRKFILFALIIIIPISTCSIVSLIISKKINENYDTMLNKMSTANEIKNSLSTSYNSFNNYLLTNSEKSKSLYISDYKQAINKVVSLQSNSDLQSRYILRDLLNSLNSYKTSADNAVRIYDAQYGIDVLYNDYVSAKEIDSDCNTFIAKLNDSYLNYNYSIYNKLKEKESFIYRMMLVYIILALLISIIYTLYFLKNILEKLHELVETSKKVSSGDFSYFRGKKSFIYELDILSEAFTTMINSIKKYINSLQEKAELENELRDNEMKLLKYQNALKLSQLKVLQSQINPHFLFNTLNCIVQTAISENALKTEGLIHSVSGILRYSLSMMNKNATLEEELNVVKQYMFIQKLRYGDRIKFNLNMDQELSGIMVPGMTLQPFVENAFIHGIEPKEEGGEININIYKKNGNCSIVIEDTGCGIEADMINKIISEDSELDHKGDTTGMGIKSVVQRIELMYDIKNVFKIESELGTGTKIYLEIPIRG